MNILSWNCRSVAGPSTVQELVDLCKRVHPAILFPMETRAHRGRLEELRRKLGFDELHCVEADGLSGGLGLFWKKEMLIQVMHANQNFIHVQCYEKDGGAFWDGTFLYGNPSFSDRRHLWNKLQQLQLDHNNPWLCIGDFKILAQDEKQGLRLGSQRQIELFKDFLNETGLMDFDVKGCKFTWYSNPRDGIVTRERIDRCVANWQWRSSYPNAVVQAQPAISSDHCPLILFAKPKVGDGGRFKFEAFWEDHTECKEVVRRGWEWGHSGLDSWSTVMEKSRSCKQELVQWNHATFKNATTEIRNLKKQLSNLMNAQESEVDWDRVKTIRQQITQLWNQEEKY